MARPLANDDTVAGRIRAYFKRNPEDALTVRDAAVKFDASKDTVKSALRFEVQCGRLVRMTRGLYEPPPIA